MNKLRPLFAIFCYLLASGCYIPRIESKKVADPDPIIIKFPRFNLGGDLTPFFGCNKAESDQPVPKGDEILERSVTLKQIQQLVRRVGCDGNAVAPDKMEVIQTPKAVVKVGPSEALKDLNFVHIENLRTCMTKRKVVDINGDEELKLENNPLNPFEFYPSRVAKEGGVQFVAELSSNNLLVGGFRVLKGINVIQIKYLGKCLKNRKDRKVTENDAEGCVQAAGLKTIGLKLKVDLEEETLPGVYEKNVCEQPQHPPGDG